jgi:hypothetical protein
VNWKQKNSMTLGIDFYFGVLHPVARILSRLMEEPSLATTLNKYK